MLAPDARRAQLDYMTKMNTKEIATRIRIEANAIEDIIKKLQFRHEHLSWLADSLESDGKPPVAEGQKPVSENKFRKLIDKVYGEKQ